jgi:hypothetical protein
MSGHHSGLGQLELKREIESCELSIGMTTVKMAAKKGHGRQWGMNTKIINGRKKLRKKSHDRQWWMNTQASFQKIRKRVNMAIGRSRLETKWGKEEELSYQRSGAKKGIENHSNLFSFQEIRRWQVTLLQKSIGNNEKTNACITNKPRLNRKLKLNASSGRWKQRQPGIRTKNGGDAKKYIPMTTWHIHKKRKEKHVSVRPNDGSWW